MKLTNKTILVTGGNSGIGYETAKFLISKGNKVIITGRDMAKLEKAGKSVDKAATKGANKTAELASKGKSAVVDQVYKDKTGPDGQTVYIDHSSKYYYVDSKGKKVYLKKSELIAK